MSLDQRNISDTLSSLSVHLSQSGKIRQIFGVAGDPITPLIPSCESYGIQFFAFRNEQAASYAASIVSFLTCRKSIGVCLSVAGPGFTNTLTGLANACKNEWPMILICPLATNEGDFQSFDQLAVLSSAFCRGYVVYNNLMESVDSTIKLALDQRGPVVLFVSTDRANLEVDNRIKRTPTVPAPILEKSFVITRPVLVIGSMTPMYPEIAAQILSFIEENQIPFFADPMARGIIPESHNLCITASKNLAMSSCSVAIIVCGKLDWMLHNGKAPKWARSTGFMFVNPGDDLGSIASRKFAVDTNWVRGLIETGKMKKAALENRLSSTIHEFPSHWQAIGAIKQFIRKNNLVNSIIISEGANTMDVSRVALDDISFPRKRLDAGRWGTMGSGLGFVIASCSLNPNELVIAIEGDSAIGFSGMELETIARYKCKCLIIVFNNSGIYTGARDNATALGPVCHAKLMEAVGGYGITSRSDPSRPEIFLNRAIEFVNKGMFPVLVDLIIDPLSGTVSGSLSRL